MTYEKGILDQNLGFVRPKYVVLDGIKSKILELGPLATSFDVTLEYPRRETQANSRDGTQKTVRRRIVVKKLDSKPYIKGIGQTYTSETFRNQDLRQTLEVEGIGQVDLHTIEISIWTTDSKDRDLLIDLIKIWMLELNKRVEPDTGLPFFLKRGVFSVDEVKNYENVDRGVDNNNNYYVGILVYNLTAPFYGVHVETFEKIKFELISNLIDPNIPNTVIVPPGTGPIGGGGGGGGSGGDSTDVITDNNSPPEKVEIPKARTGFYDATEQPTAKALESKMRLGTGGVATKSDTLIIHSGRDGFAQDYDLSLLKDEEE